MIGRIGTVPRSRGNVCVWTPLIPRGSDSERVSVRSYSGAVTRVLTVTSGGLSRCQVSASGRTDAEEIATSTAPVGAQCARLCAPRAWLNPPY